MINFILKHLLNFALQFIKKKVNLPPNIANAVNSLFNTNLNQGQIDIKTDRKLLIAKLLQASSQTEANKIREILKEKDRKERLPESLMCCAIFIGAIILPFLVEKHELVQCIFLSLVLIIGVVKYQSYRYLRFYPCEFCFTTSKISDYQQIDLTQTGSSQYFSFKDRYTGSDSFTNYYRRDTYQTVTNLYDRKCKCPCCGYEQVIKVQTSRTSQI